jgi:hypothetical protein
MKDRKFLNRFISGQPSSNENKNPSNIILSPRKNTLKKIKSSSSEHDDENLESMTIVHEFKNDSNKFPPPKSKIIEPLKLSKKEIKFEQLKDLRKIMDRKKRMEILKNNSLLLKLSKCAAKIDFISILESLSEKWKDLFKFYLKKCFLIHTHIRQVKNKNELLLQRQNIYEAIEFPDSLNFKQKLKNNIVKNFCKGFVNFIVMYYEDLILNNFLNSPKPRDLSSSQIRFSK